MVEIHLEDWEEEIFVHSNEFIKEFFPKIDVWEILSVHWNSTSMKVDFVLHCGQHCSNSFTIKEWIEYYESK